MKISELDIQESLSRVPLAEDNTFILINYATDDEMVPETKTTTLKELSNMIINNHHLLRYTGNGDKNLTSIEFTNNTYGITSSLGQFIDAADRTVLDNALTNVAYDGTNKKLVSTTRSNAQPNDIVTVSTILTDMNLNNTDANPSNSKFVSQVVQTKGLIDVKRRDFAPSITWTNAVAGTNDAKPTINISVAGNNATAQTPNEASTTVYGITKLSNDINSSSETIAATSKAVKDAVESLTNLKGANNGLAELDANGHVPSSQLPSYVDDVIEGTLATFPATGETGKIYVDTSTNTSYRWSGTQYTKIASDLSIGTTSSTAYRGDYGAQAYSWASDAYTHAVTNKGIAAASNLYKITTNSEGHVTAATAASESDIMALHSAHTAYDSGLYKVTINNKGHITAATAVQKSDITGLGIPGSDTTYEMDGTYNASTNKVATVSTVTSAVSGLYTKPASGIPSTDLADTYVKLPELPTTDGTYNLQVTISTGNDPVYSWEAVT